MKNSLEEKRKEIFELHQSWLRPDIPLMRKPAEPKVTVKSDPEVPAPTSSSGKNRFVTGVFVLTLILVILELLFFASELGWL